MNRLSPSLLAADARFIGEAAAAAARGGAELLHLDIMDGHFVPNLSFGPHVVKALSRGSGGLELDVHLMVEKPSDFVEAFLDAGADILNVHIETETPEVIRSLLSLIRSRGRRPAVTIKPATPIGRLAEFLPLADMALVMTVEPGFGGQAFLPGSPERLAEAKRLIYKYNPACDLQADGGITLENCKACLDAGANVIVAGSAVFGAEDIELRTKEFMKILNP